MKPMAFSELAPLLTGNQSAMDYQVRRLVLDSRQATAGDLFLPFRGRHLNGHEFITAALAQGAAALAQNGYYRDHAAQFEQQPVLPVADVGDALLRLAEQLRADSSTRFIAITGSAGKTTLKELVYHILRGELNTGCSPGNLNSTQGVPLSICNHLEEQEWFVMEIGANRPGEIAMLSRLVKPRIAVITNIGWAHVGPLGGPDGIARAKSELWEGLVPEGTAVLPLSEQRVVDSARELPRTVGCSLDTALQDGDLEPDYSAVVLGQDEWGRRRLRIEEQELLAPVPGAHGAELALLAWTIAREVGLAPAAIAARLEDAEPVSGRFVIHATPHGRIIDDSYNASPDSMRAALRTLAEIPTSGRRVAVLAGMAELGEWSEQLHREVAAYANTLPIHRFLILGEEASALHAELSGQKQLFLDPESLLAELRRIAAPDDLILCKGSNIYGLSAVVRELLK